MIVNGTITEKVSINPKDVIKKLIEEEIGSDSWIFEKDAKFYRGFEISAGCHCLNDKEEISQEKYEYVKALKFILEKLKNK